MTKTETITCYHGTSQEFTDLEPSWAAKWDSNGTIPVPALFFTTDLHAAEYFATGQEIEQGPNPRIISAEIDESAITDLDMTDEDAVAEWVEDHADDIWDGEITAIRARHGLDHAAIVVFSLDAIAITGETAC